MNRQTDESRIYKMLIIIYTGYLFLMTLNPYDFSFNYLNHLMGFNTLKFIEFIFHVNIWDISLNILLFIPFGILAAEIKKSSNKEYNVRYFPPVIYAFILSLSIEIIQLFLERSTSVIDLTANSLGSFIGVYLVNRHEAALFQSIRRFSVGMKRAYRIVLAYLFLFFLMVIALIPYSLNNTKGWMDSYHIVFGNESTGDRPWKGVLQRVTIYNRAFSRNMIKKLYEAGKSDILEIKRSGGLAHYNFTATSDSSVLKEILYHSIALNLNGRNYLLSDEGVGFTKNGMLISYLGAKFITDGIQKTNSFTVEAWLKTLDLNQEGPARIVSVSKGPEERNFTLAQKGRDVHLRVRTMLAGRNGSRINLRANNILNDTLFHQIVVTFNRGVERIALDGKIMKPMVRGDIDFIPFILRLGTNSFSKIAFYLLFLVPLGILFYSLGEPLREVRLAGIIFIYVFLAQLFYYVKAGQPFGFEFFMGAIISVVISISLGSMIKKANQRGFLNK